MWGRTDHVLKKPNYRAGTYVLVVDDDPLLAGGLVRTRVLVDTPVAAPLAHNATAATAEAERTENQSLLVFTTRKVTR